MPKLSAKAIACAMTIAGFSALGAADALAGGVFTDFAGSWRGAGRITDVHGKSEGVTCKSTNSPSSDGIAMQLSLTCASDSYKVDFHTELFTDGHELHGTWSETTRAATGNVSGEIRSDMMRAIVSAPGFDATIVARVAGAEKLDVTLDAHGVSINHVAVTMKK